MLYFFAPLVGAVITLMSGLNSRLSEAAGYLVAAPVIHIAGLATVSLILLFRPEPRRPGRLPPYFYSGGVFGVATVFASAYAFASLGASMAVALSLVGQTLFSLAADAAGIFGRKRYPISARNIPGVALALAGAAVMVGDWRTDAPAMLAALTAGAIPGFTFILNSELGRKKGLFRSVRINYITGLSTSLAVLLISGAALSGSVERLANAGAALVLGGGIMGVVVVASMNYIMPRMSAFYATLLAFAGQAFTGLAVDFAAAGLFDPRKLTGTLVLLAGLAINALLTKRAEGSAAGNTSQKDA
jgi:bacterial/archaeal transporter family-2 protein